ncbi:sugar ABC transporter substrate-binding protein [Clostridium novyi A str. 4552]|uniref:Sugar ABC transporter substrate-binding protein n=2 Tax=Clostridium novyi TaxID=1542 RepID=A0A0A0IAY8_CLONO|nr:sugar ABC transporter substrate-binding protein [Clostridium novyi A str. 4552]
MKEELIMKGKKLLGIILTLGMLSCVFGGCGNSADQGKGGDKGKGGNVAVVLKALNSDYWKTVQAGANDAAKELGVKVQVLGPNAETDVVGQTSLIEDQIVKGVDALVVAPLQPNAAITTFDKAEKEKIPVVLIDTDANWDKKKSFVGTGNIAAGKLGGEYIAKKLKKGDEAIIIRGVPGDRTQDERTQGAQKALEAAGIKVVEIQPANSEREKAISVMENLLQTHPNIKGVFCTNDEMALGAVKALQQAGKKNIISIGVDGSPDALKSIKEGGLTGTVAQNSYDIGKKGVETAVKVLRGEKVETRIDTGTTLVDKQNVNEQEAKLNKILGK